MTAFAPTAHAPTAYFAAAQGAPPPGDTIEPTLTGQLAVSGITHNSATLTVPTASDNVGVVGYEWSIDGGATYPLTSTLPTKAVSGLPSAATIAARARAYDDAGNLSDPLAATFSTAAAPPPDHDPSPGGVDAIDIPAPRKVIFSGGTRVVTFDGGTRTVRF